MFLHFFFFFYFSHQYTVSKMCSRSWTYGAALHVLESNGGKMKREERERRREWYIHTACERCFIFSPTTKTFPNENLHAPSLYISHFSLSHRSPRPFLLSHCLFHSVPLSIALHVESTSPFSCCSTHQLAPHCIHQNTLASPSRKAFR